MGLAPGMQLHGIYGIASMTEPNAQIRILSLGHDLTEITGFAEIRRSVDLGHYGTLGGPFTARSVATPSSPMSVITAATPMPPSPTSPSPPQPATPHTP